MVWLRRYLRSSVASRLRQSRHGLHLAPRLRRWHVSVAGQLVESGPGASLARVIVLWLCAVAIDHCVEQVIRAQPSHLIR